MRRMQVVYVLFAALIGTCATSFPADQARVKRTSIAKTEFVDLTHSLGEGSPMWPGSAKFKFTKKVTIVLPPPENSTSTGDRFTAFNDFSVGEHGGTHLDAPYHFNRTGWKVDDIPVDRLIVPGVLIDASKAAAADRDLSLGVDALEAWEAVHGPVPQGAVVLFRFGWASKYSNREDYFGNAAGNQEGFSFPGLSDTLAAQLVARGVVGVGVDTSSVDSGRASARPDLYQTHYTLASANIYNLENLDLRSDKLPPKGFTLHVFPMKISEATGAPARIVASIPKK